MKKSGVKYYRSCDTLPLFNFYKFVNTRDLNWLIKGYDEDSDLTHDDSASDIARDIIDEYESKSNDNSSHVKKYMILAQLSEMEMEFRIVNLLLSIYMRAIEKKRLKEALNDWGYNPDNIEDIIKKLEVLKFQISMFRGKNKDIIDESKDKKEKPIFDLWKDIVNIETALGNGTTIDPHTTVLSKWINLILIAEKKNKNDG